MGLTLLPRPWSGVVVLFTVLVALTAMLAACEYPGLPRPLAGQAAGETRPTPPPQAPETPAPGKGEPTPGPGAQEGPLEVALKDFSLEPDQLTVRAGKVIFVLKNEGRYTHDFRVEGQGVDEKAPKVAAGRERQWEVNLKPGEYRISCPISNHDERGMVGTLVVK